MAVSPQQIQNERDTEFQKRVDAAETQIDGQLRLFFDDASKADGIKIDLAGICKTDALFKAVCQNYEAAGWAIEKVPSINPLNPVSYYFSLGR